MPAIRADRRAKPAQRASPSCAVRKPCAQTPALGAARHLLYRAGMTTQATAQRAKPAKRSEAWTIPLHVIMWTTIMVAFIMVVVVFMMR